LPARPTSRPERRSDNSISPRSAASGVRSSWASAALNCRILPHLADRVLEPRQRVVECRRHVLELVVHAARGQPSLQRPHIDLSRRAGQDVERPQREAGEPPRGGR